MKYLKILAHIFFCTACLQSCVMHSEFDVVEPASINMSKERLAQIDTLLQQGIKNKWINGAVAYIARDRKTVYYKAFGTDDTEKKTPMTRDAIFRIASQTKAITSVAVMILFDEGKLLLDDPVSKYIPEFANPRVIDKYEPKDTTYTTLPADRQITIRDLLTHTSGIDYAKIGSPLMTAIYEKAGIPVGFETQPVVLADEMKKLGQLPLSHQPGKQFTYGLNCDVLGYIIEIVSGMPLDRFFRQRIFDPLGMTDTYFYLPREKYSRLVSVYTEDPEKGVIKWPKNMGGIDVNYPVLKGTYFSGGAGLSSTIKDYAIFLQMLLNGGQYKDTRILSERSVKLMTVNQIGNLNLGRDKFGLGFEITTKDGEAELGVSEGSYSWGGFFGTTYWVDPDKKLVCLLFCQQYPLNKGDLDQKFRTLVYAAIE